MFSISVIALYGREKTEELYQELKHKFPKELEGEFDESEKTGRRYFPFDRNSEEYQYIKQVAKENNIPIYNEYEKTVFTPEEEKNMQWFLMGVSYPLEAEGKHTVDYGTEYVDCCPKCKIGGKVKGDILIDRKFIRKQGIACVVPDIIVTPQVKWAFEQENLTGVSFKHNVSDWKGREMPDYYSMIIESILPPMDEKTWFRTDPPAKHCSECGRIVPYVRSNYYYKKKDFDNAKDFNYTYEFLNNWTKRSIIISKRVKDVLKKYKIRAGWNMCINIEE